MDSSIDQAQCPLCQKNNHCGVNGAEPCWCVSSDIKPDLLAQVPKNFSGKACVCQKCIDKFNTVIIVDRT